jgi:probable rRNA maturation factor
MNARFRGVDAATDVLSFPSGDGPERSSRKSLGDIAICLPVARAQAATHNTTLSDEIACLAVHGGLHLLGYDDRTMRGRKDMISKMLRIVRSIGLAPSAGWSSSHYQW